MWYCHSNEGISYGTFPFESARGMNDMMETMKSKKKEEGMYILRTGNKVALNLVIGSRTLRLAEFKDFDVAYNFAMSIQARNEELKVFVASS